MTRLCVVRIDLSIHFDEVLTRIRILAISTAILTAFFALNPAQAACRHALVIALDVSSSVGQREYQLQMNGLGRALQDPDVQAMLLAQPSAPVELAVFEWSGRNTQRLIIDWTTIDDPIELIRIAGRLMAQERPNGATTTAIGRALSFAGQLLRTRPKCWQRTVDISGDGKNNDGYRPQVAKQAAEFADITVNGLVIGIDAPPADQVVENEISELSSYFRQEVIHGPYAFVETALGSMILRLQ